MKAHAYHLKEEDIRPQTEEKSELMQLFEAELTNPYRGHLDLLNAILEEK